MLKYNLSKKLLSFAVIFGILSSCTLAAFAAEKPFVVEGSAAVTKLVPAHSMTMPDEKDSATARSTDRMQANYSYTFEVSEESPNRAAVSVQAILLVDNTRIPVQAAGTIQSYQIAESDYLWEGPLDGFATYLNEPCRIVIGFAKLDSSSDIQLTITGQDKDLAGISYVLGSVMTPEIEQAMFDYAIEDESEYFSANTLSARSTTDALLPEDYSFVSGRFAYFADSNINSFAQYARIYYSDLSNTLILSLSTFVSTLENYYASYSNYLGYNHDPHIQSFTLSLTATDGATGPPEHRSSIIGIVADAEIINISPVERFLINVFESLVNFFDIIFITVPISMFIEDVLRDLTGEVSISYNPHYASTYIYFPSTERTNFDDINKLGFPMVVYLNVSDSNVVYTGDSPYRYESSVRYRIPTVIGTINPTVAYAYLDAQDISCTIALDID